MGLKKFVKQATAPVAKAAAPIIKPVAKAVANPIMTPTLAVPSALYGMYKSNQQKGQEQAGQWENLDTTGGAAGTAQQQALNMLQGLDPMGQYSEAQQRAESAASGTYGNLAQNRAAMGKAGGFKNLGMAGAKAQSLQAGGAQAGFDRNAMARTSALNQLQQTAGMAGDFRQQEFSEAAARAKGIAGAYGQAGANQASGMGNVIGGAAKIFGGAMGGAA